MNLAILQVLYAMAFFMEARLAYLVFKDREGAKIYSVAAVLLVMCFQFLCTSTYFLTQKGLSQ